MDTSSADPPRRLSSVLREQTGSGGARVSLGELVTALGARGFAPLLLLLAAPNLFLYVPGASTITGVPLLLVSVQLLRGRPGATLPGLLARRAMERSSFRRMVGTALPWIERVERMARPRWWPPGADRVAGITCLVMAVLLILPIPFVNALPGLAVVLLALGLSERDGLWLSAGLVVALACLAATAAVVGGAAFALAHSLA